MCSKLFDENCSNVLDSHSEIAETLKLSKNLQSVELLILNIRSSPGFVIYSSINEAKKTNIFLEDYELDCIEDKEWVSFHLPRFFHKGRHNFPYIKSVGFLYPHITTHAIIIFLVVLSIKTNNKNNQSFMLLWDIWYNHEKIVKHLILYSQ